MTDKTTAALKLAEPDMNLNCPSVQARLATIWGYVKAEQEKQEPVAKVFEYALSSARQLLDYADDSDGCQYGTLSTSLVRDAMEQILPALIAAQQPVQDIMEAVDAAMAEMQNINPPLRRSECERLIRAANYAAPVRTKDLTDDEIEAIHGCPPAEWVRRFARAIIAADREKNK